MSKKNNPAQASAQALDKFLSVANTALMLGISKQFVHKLLKEGKLRHSRLGRRILIKLSDIEAMLEATKCS
jgi:excisionase family DNA binding protein